ncbi:MAG: tetratricopeptide repeat protein, partial [Planctomycetota bacterium]
AGAAGVFGLLASDLRRTWLLPGSGIVLATLLLRGPDATLIDAGAFLYGRDRFKEKESDAKPTVRRAARLIFHGEGEDLVAAVYERGTDNFLVVNGKIDASSYLDAETQRLVGHLPILLHGGAVKKVAIVGLGSGMTADAAVSHPGVERVDTVEISRTVVEAVRASTLFQQLTHGVLDDPRHRLLIGDGRTHIRHSRERYDVIISEPTNPWIAGVGDLYTTEHFTNVKERLAPGGVFAQWLQGYATTSALYWTIVRTFTDVFPDAQLWRFAGSADTLLVARREGGPLTVKFSEVKQAMLASPRLKASLEDAGMEGPESLAWYFDLDPPGVRTLAAGEVRNTDDSGWLEHRAPFALYEFANPLDEKGARELQKVAASPFPELDAETSRKIRAALPVYHEAVLLAESANGAYLADAEKRMRRALELGPREAPLVRHQLAAILALRLARAQYGVESEARAAFDEIARLEPRALWVIDLYAQAARRAKLAKEETAALRKIVALRPLLDEPRVRLAEVLSAQRDHQGALDALAPLATETADVLAGRGLALAGLGRLDEARAAIEKAVGRDPSSSRAWATLGVIRAQANDLAGAKAAFEKVVALRPKEAAGWFQLGLACFKLGDGIRAEECCRKALEIDPNDERAKGLLSHIKQR